LNTKALTFIGDGHVSAVQLDTGEDVKSTNRLTGEINVHAIFRYTVEQGRVVGLNLAGFDIECEGADLMNSLKQLDLPVMAVG
jgi:hypothetical protein